MRQAQAAVVAEAVHVEGGTVRPGEDVDGPVNHPDDEQVGVELQEAEPC